MNRYITICMVYLIFGCSAQEKQKTSFFVAGHTYGNPREKNREKIKGLYQPFKEKIGFFIR